jgi:hypothetical protein
MTIPEAIEALDTLTLAIVRSADYAALSKLFEGASLMCTPAQARAYDDMLAALQSVITWYGEPPHHPAPAVVKARAAVAQAITARPAPSQERL